MSGLSPGRARTDRREAAAIGRRTHCAGLQSRDEELRSVSYAGDRSARLAFQIHRSSDSHRQTGRDLSVLNMISGNAHEVGFSYVVTNKFVTTWSVYSI